MSSDIVTVLILAVVQGLTEFLPVSSSGHLVLIGALMEARTESAGSIIFEISVHVGTLGAVITVYREKISRICSSLGGWIAGGFRSPEKHGDEIRYTGWIILGSVPAAFVGLLLRDRIVTYFDSPSTASLLLVATGVFISLSKGKGGHAGLTWRTVLIIGAAQAVAIMPGCSRSGWTIAAALLLGIGFERAAEFSFLLSIPAVAGALVLELAAGTVRYSPAGAIYLVAGAAAAFASGLAALKLLIYLLGRGTFHRFSWYLVPAGLLYFIYFAFIRGTGAF